MDTRHRPVAAPLTAKRTVCVVNDRGLHARAAARFVKLAERYESEIRVDRNGVSVSGRSIMGLMMLAAGPGCDIVIVATGPDAKKAVTALAKLVRDSFGEENERKRTASTG